MDAVEHGIGVVVPLLQTQRARDLGLEFGAGRGIRFLRRGRAQTRLRRGRV